MLRRYHAFQYHGCSILAREKIYTVVDKILTK
jgi:hypothetical protein